MSGNSSSFQALVTLSHTLAADEFGGGRVVFCGPTGISVVLPVEVFEQVPLKHGRVRVTLEDYDSDE